VTLKSTDDDHALLLADLRSLISSARVRVATNANSELVGLYWQVGQRIRRDVLHNERAEYGQAVIVTVARSLQVEYGNGFDRSNLSRAVKFAELFDAQIVATLSQQLTWSHVKELLPFKEPLQREFYLQMAMLERWSVRGLREKINGLLFERTALSKQPEEVVRHELEQLRESGRMTPDLVFKDPYLLNFLDLQAGHSERDLENAILREMERFLLELGAGFSFVARQKRISVGHDDYYLDLLFYHRKLRRLVAVELKLEKFQAAHKGQMELYLRWLDKHEREHGEEAPLGLILCSSAEQEHVELLDLQRDNIRVAEYLTGLPPLEVLQDRLHRSIEVARSRMLEPTDDLDAG
jgi:predicted nuclease of restriction endonuclease-like (RecB) superfamily